MRTILVGAVESSRVALDRIARTDGWSVELVLTLPLARSARHSDFVDLGPSAQSAGADIMHVLDINAEEALAAVREIKPDFAFVVGWSQICGSQFREACAGRVIGYHPSALPRMRGRAVIPWTILNDEPITASTLFWIDEGVDTGAILAQQFFHVSPAETAGSLYRKHMDALDRIMVGALDSLSSGDALRVAQDESCATWTARRTANDGRIDWTQPARDIQRLVRAVGGPYPAAFTFDGVHQVDIERAELIAGERRFLASPGQIVAASATEFTVMCGDGALLKVIAWAHPQARAPRLHAPLSSQPTTATITSPSVPPLALAYERGQTAQHA